MLGCDIQPQLEPGIRDLRATDLDRVLDHAMDVDGREGQGQPPGRGPGQVEQVVDQPRLELDVAMDHRQRRSHLRAQVGLSSRSETASRTGVSGVRSSWLKIARNWSFARLAASAASLASCSSWASRRRSVMSRNATTAPLLPPWIPERTGVGQHPSAPVRSGCRTISSRSSTFRRAEPGSRVLCSSRSQRGISSDSRSENLEVQPMCEGQ